MPGYLPNGIAEVLDYLAMMARGYDNHLKWNEVANLKGDLMNERDSWTCVPVDLISVRCLELGMRPDDAQVAHMPGLLLQQVQ